MISLLYLAASAAGAVLAAASLPLLLELLVLSVAARLRPRVAPAQPAPTFRLAVIVPAHNEEKLVGACVRSVTGAEVWVVAHNCTDSTAEEARSAGAQVLVLNDSVGGKGVALDHGFRHALAAGAHGVVVLDADSVASPNLPAAVSARLAAGADALQCRYEVANARASMRTGLAAVAFLGINVLRPRGRDRLGLSCGIFGNGFALCAATLRRVPYTANSLVEDLEYHLHLIRAGLRVEFVDEAAVLGEMPEGTAASVSQRARWEGGRMQMRRTWRGPLAREVVRGRVRMLEPLFDLLSVPLATEVALLAGAGILAWAAHLRWLGLYAALGAVACVLYLLVAASLSARPSESLRALVFAPAYMAWKITMIPRTRLAARRNAAWVRTERNPERKTERSPERSPDRNPASKPQA